MSIAISTSIGARRTLQASAWHRPEAVIAENRAELQRELADAAQSGDVTLTDVSAGVNVGLIQSVDPAAEIVRRTVAEAETVMRARCSELLRP